MLTPCQNHNSKHRKKRLLVINPNTSKHVSLLLRDSISGVCGVHSDLDVITARWGASYIVDERSYAVAAHAALDTWSNAIQSQICKPDTVLIGCFGDPGLFALKECCDLPVTGLAEASFQQAAAIGDFAIVTGGRAWAPILERIARGTEFGTALTGIRTVEATGADLARDAHRAHELLYAACSEAASIPGVKSVILGGAGLVGFAKRLQPHFNIPLIDSVRAGAEVALAMAAEPSSG
ncbi:aspartate/glutamate racemase family protein [Diaphorobacter caeni]|uniref:aspartate/glutamate racemase family protein n=1 Tax=Diaphorobacter caeni TaxID=2784387 RepID=UPI0018905F4F|nr:aspartate/glutamate racemase family protein [Diaphorobacter caeni]MBF5005812.1 Asp/Glu racemase [Diaphorobacter caeni]